MLLRHSGDHADGRFQHLQVELRRTIAASVPSNLTNSQHVMNALGRDLYLSRDPDRATPDRTTPTTLTRDRGETASSPIPFLCY